MYGVVRAKQFERSIRKLKKSGNLTPKLYAEINEVVATLAFGGQLSKEYSDHALKGKWEGYRECHIRGDLLLVYQIIEDKLVLVLSDIGSHSYLFG
jgi:mRNA interferase YafQ